MAGYKNGKVEIWYGDTPPTNLNILWQKRIVTNGVESTIMYEFNTNLSLWQVHNSGASGLYIVGSYDDIFSINQNMSNGSVSIINDIDLLGHTLDLLDKNVSGLTIVFNGGRIINGKINPYKTSCVFNSVTAFVNVEILGRFENNSVKIEALGAKCDGLDGGIGDFTHDDSFAINQSINFASTVIIPSNKTTIVKKPIILKSNTNLHLEDGAILKAGDASNCTMIKSEWIDIPNNGYGYIQYPDNYIRSKNISITGNGLIDCNGWMQNRADSLILHDNPEVIGTPVFNDLDGLPYIGFSIKIADVDNLVLKDFRIRNPRTYAFAMAGLNGYEINSIYGDRTSFRENQDFIHFHGNCFNGRICGVKGVSGDDFIAITTTEAGPNSIRIGDFKNCNISNIQYWGINPDATPESPIEINNELADGFSCHRLLRLTYVDETIDNIVIQNCQTTQSKLGGQIVLSNLPARDKSNGRNGYGGGKIGTVIIDNLRQHESWGFIDTSDYVDIDNLYISNITESKTSMNFAGCFLRFGEAFDTPPMTDSSHSTIGNVVINNVKSDKGQVFPFPSGFIEWAGVINKMYINNFTGALINGTSFNYYLFIKANVKSLTITNSNLQNFDEIIYPFNSDCFLFEKDNILNNNTTCIYQLSRAITDRLKLTTYPASPEIGDLISSHNGQEMFDGSTWSQLYIKNQNISKQLADFYVSQAKASEFHSVGGAGDAFYKLKSIDFDNENEINAGLGSLSFLCNKTSVLTDEYQFINFLIAGSEKLRIFKNGKLNITGNLSETVVEFTDNAAAIAGGLTAGEHYRTGDIVKIVH